MSAKGWPGKMEETEGRLDGNGNDPVESENQIM